MNIGGKLIRKMWSIRQGNFAFLKASPNPPIIHLIKGKA